MAKGDLKQGEKVRVRIPGYSGYVGMLLVFVLPMVLFIAGVAAGLGLEGEGAGHGVLPVAGGIAGLVVAFLIAWLTDRALLRRVPVQVRPAGPAA